MSRSEQLKSVEKPKCVRRKYKSEDTARRSSMYLASKTHRRASSPEFCDTCKAWHMNTH